MVITIDKENSVLPNPEFVEPMYKATYSEDGDFTLKEEIKINDIGYKVTYDWDTNLNPGNVK